MDHEEETETAWRVLAWIEKGEGDDNELLERLWKHRDYRARNLFDAAPPLIDEELLVRMAASIKTSDHPGWWGVIRFLGWMGGTRTACALAMRCERSEQGLTAEQLQYVIFALEDIGGPVSVRYILRILEAGGGERIVNAAANAIELLAIMGSDEAAYGGLPTAPAHVKAYWNDNRSWLRALYPWSCIPTA